MLALGASNLRMSFSRFRRIVVSDFSARKTCAVHLKRPRSGCRH